MIGRELPAYCFRIDDLRRPVEKDRYGTFAFVTSDSEPCGKIHAAELTEVNIVVTDERFEPSQYSVPICVGVFKDNFIFFRFPMENDSSQITFCFCIQ